MQVGNAFAGLATVLLLSLPPLVVAVAQEPPPELPAASASGPEVALSIEELKARIAAARAALGGEISDEERRKLRRQIKQDEIALKRAERDARKQEPEPQAEETVSEPEAPLAQPPAAAASPEQNEAPPVPQADPGSDALAIAADKLITDTESAADMSDEALRDRIRQARALFSNEELGEEYRGPLNALVISARQEIAARAAKAGGEAKPAQPEASEVDARAERRAREFLADDEPAEALRNDELRRRLERARDLLGEGGLSPETEGALRQRLGGDRAVLRSRLSQAEPPPVMREDEKTISDRRPAAELSETELNLRIAALRTRIADEKTLPEDEARLRKRLIEARGELGERYARERQRRAERLRDGTDIDIGINIDLGGIRGAPTEDVWAAEADDAQIERQLVARPARPLPPGYQFEREELIRDPYPVLTRPEVRSSLPAVELDTVHFGFNEAALREEEIANLDRLGRIMERILAAHPEEVFVIEGHTDAVGSDSYNLALSRQRALAVRAALMEYYVVPARNLTVVGLGERFLKIPTPDPEQENRRVTVRRITPLVSGYRSDVPGD